MLITEYDQATQLLPDNVLLQDGPGGTKKITAKQLAKMLPGLLTASEFAEFIDMRNLDRVATLKPDDMILVRNNNQTKSLKMSKDVYYDVIDEFITMYERRTIFRLRLLGDKPTEEQIANIKNGTFKGLFPGDYWYNDKISWVVYDFDFFDHFNETRHHVVVGNNESIAGVSMNDTVTTTGGYLGSMMQTTHIPNLLTKKVEPVFGAENIAPFRDLMVNTNSQLYDFGAAGAYATVKGSLMSKSMIYGGSGSVKEFPTSKTQNQLAAFMDNPGMASGYGFDYWLRDVVNESTFSCVSDGHAIAENANMNHNVRMIFCFGPPMD